MFKSKFPYFKLHEPPKSMDYVNIETIVLIWYMFYFTYYFRYITPLLRFLDNLTNAMHVWTSSYVTRAI